VLPQGSGQTQLDQTAFLRLMTTQLNAQDPFNPMDNTQMVAQMAQFSSVAGISEMNASLRAITDQIAEQTQLLTDLSNRLSPAPTPEV
jgi:flagellar basal-body rod modification protein FlgD